MCTNCGVSEVTSVIFLRFMYVSSTLEKVFRVIYVQNSVNRG